MSVQRVSRKLFSGFLDLIVWLVRRINLTGSSAARQPARLSRDVTTVDLERYYATPGKAEWGC